MMPPLDFISEKAATAAAMFGLDPTPTGADRAPRPIRRAAALVALRINLALAPGHIALITGPSGAGKSMILRTLHARSLQPAPSLPSPLPSPLQPPLLSSLPPLPLVDLFPLPLDQTLSLLARVGLAEATLFTRLPSELSDGQRARLDLALALCPAEPHAQARGSRGAHNEQPIPAPSHVCGVPPFDSTRTTREHATGCLPRARTWLCYRAISSTPVLARGAPPDSPAILADEFLSTLDRTTAANVARSIRRCITRESNLRLIAATAHDDLLEPLAPDLLVQVPLGLGEGADAKVLTRVGGAPRASTGVAGSAQ